MKSKLIQMLSIIVAVFCFAGFALAQTAETTTTKGGFFSAENIITLIISGLASVGITQFLKNKTGLYGAGATILAIFISVVVATVGFITASFFSGNFSWETVASGVGTIFTLATFTYRLIPLQSEASE